MTRNGAQSNLNAGNESFLKDTNVLMHCTGGIRCENSSVALEKRGVEDVSQVQGGIHCYLEQYHWIANEDSCRFGRACEKSLSILQ
jgi:predicted sulfurtransferase